MTKVHREAVKFASEGYTIVLIGHAGHEEVEGTMGEAPDHIVLVETEADVDALEVADPEKIAYISQTTLSVDETRAIINRLREKFPAITGPRTDDICYATTNRQAAVKQMAAHCDLLLVIGSKNSSNSNRLVQVTRELGTDAHLIDDVSEIDEAWLEGQRVVGHLARGASAPEELVQRLVDFFRARGTEQVEEFQVVQEDVRFMLPKAIRQAMAAAPRRPHNRASSRAFVPQVGGSGGRQPRVECPSALRPGARSSTPLLAVAGTVAAVGLRAPGPRPPRASPRCRAPALTRPGSPSARRRVPAPAPSTTR